MSCWTHVAGVMRIDSLRLDELEGSDNSVDFDKLIGKECLFDDDDSVWKEQEEHPENFLPMGSEGSLRKSVWINPDPSHVAAYTVSIFGDLRDHYSAQSIIDWFKKKCDQFWIRQAVITAYSIDGVLTYRYEENKEESKDD